MNQPLLVLFTPRAGRQADDAAAWWREHRSKAPNAFAEELERALELIAAEPGVGARARNARLAGVRRVLLHRVRYYLYYRIVEAPERLVQILAVWHAQRGSGPLI